MPGPKLEVLVRTRHYEPAQKKVHRNESPLVTNMDGSLGSSTKHPREFPLDTKSPASLQEKLQFLWLWRFGRVQLSVGKGLFEKRGTIGLQQKACGSGRPSDISGPFGFRSDNRRRGSPVMAPLDLGRAVKFEG